jgi:hypothetical protein
VDKGQCQVLQRPAHVEAAIAVSERLAVGDMGEGSGVLV